MSTGKLIIQEAEGGLQISGITDYPEGVEVLIGAGTIDGPIEMSVKEAAVELPAAVRRSISCGAKVMDGLIKFSQPILVRGATLQPVTSRRGGKIEDKKITPPKNVPNQSVSALAAQMPQPGGAAKGAAYELDDTGYRALLHVLDDLEAGEEHIKAASHPFHDYLIDSIEKAKVDGRTLGLSVPVKVAFRDDATRDLFVNWFGQVQRKKATIELDDLVKAASDGKPADVEMLADILVASGAVKSQLAMLAGQTG